MSIILQLSDLHLLPKNKKVFDFIETYNRFLFLCDFLKGNEYDAIVCTGDMFHECQDQELKNDFINGISGKNVFFVNGNHDIEGNSFFVHDFSDCRLIGIDSTGDISVSENFLKDTLHTNKTVLLFFHHPPFTTGCNFMDDRCNAIAQLLSDLEIRKRKVLLCCGHLHQSLVSSFSGCTVVCAPSLGFGLEFSASGYNTMVDSPAGIVIHNVHDGQFISRFVEIPGSYSLRKKHFKL